MKEVVIDYAAFRDGHCVAIAYKQGGEATRREWEAKGYDVREMPVSEACAAHKAYLRTLPAFRGLL